MKASHSSTFRGARASGPPFLASGQKPSVLLILFFTLMIFLTSSAPAQIQQAWVAHYNNGIPNGTNQAVKMALDPAGNIYVTGFSQNANSNLGYVTIKYAPAGSQLWASRYDSTNYPSAAPAALVLDNSNNVIVTGNALTVKYSANGAQLWTAAYAGTALAVDGTGDASVTGFGTNFNIVKLSPLGSNLWLRTYTDIGPTIAEAIAVDGSGDVYVSGSDISSYSVGPEDRFPLIELLTIKYDCSGRQIWYAQCYLGEPTGVQVECAGLDSANNFFLVTEVPGSGADCFATLKYSNGGSLLWLAPNPTDSVGSQGYGLSLDAYGNAFVTGESEQGYPHQCYCFATCRLSTNGVYLWTNLYPKSFVGTNVATSIATDKANNCYVTGYSSGTNSYTEIVTIKYDPDGNQIWLQQYVAPSGGNAVGNAIAVDHNGNVYVTGYESTAAGGTEMVTIKYAPLGIQRRADGTVFLQAQGSPGQSFDVQASTNLQTWQDLGSVTAGTNGVAQYEDTNAPLFDWRYYLTVPQ